MKKHLIKRSKTIFRKPLQLFPQIIASKFLATSIKCSNKIEARRISSLFYRRILRQNFCKQQRTFSKSFCLLTGRSRSFDKTFEVSRISFRFLAVDGLLTSYRKSS